MSRAHWDLFTEALDLQKAAPACLGTDGLCYRRKVRQGHTASGGVAAWLPLGKGTVKVAER